MPPTDDLTPPEAAVLVALLTNGGELLNSVLAQRFFLKLSPVGRQKLINLGYLEIEKAGQSFLMRLGDAGWARCRESFDFGASGAKSMSAVMTSLMAAVQQDLRRTHRSPAMVFAPESNSDMDATTGPAARTAPDEAPVSTRAETIEQIRGAYKERVQEPGGWVAIADIRDDLAFVERDTLDAALRELEQQPDVNIVPMANQKALTKRNRQAAVIIGRQPKHFIAIGV